MRLQRMVRRAQGTSGTTQLTRRLIIGGITVALWCTIVAVVHNTYLTVDQIGTNAPTSFAELEEPPIDDGTNDPALDTSAELELLWEFYVAYMIAEDLVPTLDDDDWQTMLLFYYDGMFLDGNYEIIADPGLYEDDPTDP